MMKSNFKIYIIIIGLTYLSLVSCSKFNNDHVLIEYVDYINYDDKKNKSDILTQNFLVSGNEKEYCNQINLWIKKRESIYKEVFDKNYLREIHLFFYKKSKILTLENKSVASDFEFESLHFLVGSYSINKQNTQQIGCEGKNPQPYYKSIK